MTDSNRKKSDPNGNTGRNTKGQFVRGAPGGPGRPAGRLAVESWRKAFADAVSPADVRAVVRILVKEAKSGERWAIEQLLDRCVGSPIEAALSERLDELEAALVADAK